MPSAHKIVAMLLMSLLVMPTVINARPIVNFAKDTVKDNNNKPIYGKSLLHIACAIMDAKCDFAAVNAVSIAPVYLKPYKITSWNETVTAAASTTKPAPVATSSHAWSHGPALRKDIDTRAPKLIFTSCGILGNSCAFSVSADVVDPVEPPENGMQNATTVEDAAVDEIDERDLCINTA